MTTVNEIGERAASALLPRPGDTICGTGVQTLRGALPSRGLVLEVAQMSGRAYGGVQVWLIRYRIPSDGHFRSCDGWAHVPVWAMQDLQIVGDRTESAAAALEAAADEIEALSYARVTGNVEVLPAIQRAAGPLAQDALTLLDAHRDSLGIRDNAVYRWTTPMSVVEVVTQLRGAAQAVTG